MGFFNNAKKADQQTNINFNITKKIGNLIAFDDINRKWQLLDDGYGKNSNPRIYDYDDIEKYELLEDEQTSADSIFRGAVIGSLLTGTTGAIIGAARGNKEANKFVNSLKIRITLYNPEGAVLFIPLINNRTERDTYAYKSRLEIAKQIIFTFSSIGISDGSQQEPQPSEESDHVFFSAADEILKFKGLLDSGIINQEEFDAKKKQLLNT